MIRRADRASKIIIFLPSGYNRLAIYPAGCEAIYASGIHQDTASNINGLRTLSQPAIEGWFDIALEGIA